MLKSELAQDLRKRQIAYGMVEKKLIERISDDDIIDCYITCSCCKEKQVEGIKLDELIFKARDTEHFFSLCDLESQFKVRVN